VEAIGVPIVLLLFAFLTVFFYLTTARGLTVDERGIAIVEQEIAKLGPVSRAECNVLLAFGITVALWIVPGLLAIAGLDGRAFARGYEKAMPEGVVAILGALLLFVLPIDWRSRRFTLTWDEAVTASIGGSCSCTAAGWRWDRWRSRLASPRPWAVASRPGCRRTPRWR
jgi:solute carrier family 13 (sodium-dependent dicarboxylate transporter), member 2/3/5